MTFTMLLVAGAASQILAAQSKYSIDWISTGGASGVSTGSVYSLTRTTGSSDSDLMNGTVHVLAGSFWSGAVVAQSPLDAVYAGIDFHDPAQALADYDGDGLSNLMEYALGTDPRSAGDAGQVLKFVISTNGANQYLTMQFKRRKNAVDLGLQYLPEVSSDGQAWYSDAANVMQVDGSSLDAQFDLVTVRDQIAITPSGPRFFRLRVIQN